MTNQMREVMRGDGLSMSLFHYEIEMPLGIITLQNKLPSSQYTGLSTELISDKKLLESIIGSIEVI